MSSHIWTFCQSVQLLGFYPSITLPFQDLSDTVSPSIIYYNILNSVYNYKSFITM